MDDIRDRYLGTDNSEEVVSSTGTPWPPQEQADTAPQYTDDDVMPTNLIDITDEQNQAPADIVEKVESTVEPELQAEAQPEGQEIATGQEAPAPSVPAVRTPKEPIRLGDGGYILPTTLEEAYRMAVAVIKGGMMPDSYKDAAGNKEAEAQKVMLGLASAMEAGLPPLYGLRQIAIINGRPSMWGDALMALVQSKNLLANQTVREVGAGFDPSLPPAQWPDDYGICVSLWRRGQPDPYVGTFTVADAKRAGLWLNTRKKPWLEHPKRMMTFRARAFPLRDGFADAIAGIAVREEIEDYHTPEDLLVPKTSAVDDDEPITESATVEEPNAGQADEKG